MADFEWVTLFWFSRIYNSVSFIPISYLSYGNNGVWKEIARYANSLQQALMDQDIDASVTVEQLRAAGTDASKQLPALVKLGKWYLNKAKISTSGDDFTKANALFNAALVRSRLVSHETSESEILGGIIDIYQEFLLSVANGVEVKVDEIRNEIDSHKEFIAKERQIFKDRLDEIDSCFNTTDRTEDQYKTHADKVHDVFRDIQEMYNRLVSMLVEECESRLGEPPCDYAVIAMGSIARMEATPFSDLEFAILYSDSAIGDKISYFRVLTHFLHLKVINLGETILPSLGIKQLNNFQFSDLDDIWFYDSVTPRGISFDGAMPWASKTPLGRTATKTKPALELIRTPEQMAELQNEETSVKEGYHLADIMSRTILLHGDQALLDEYNTRIAEKLNTTSSSAEGTSTQTVGFTRGILQMQRDLVEFSPHESYLGSHFAMGALFDAKRQFYRLISLLLSDLGLIFDIRSPSPWKIISELQTRQIIGVSESANIKVCLSIANEIRLKTYFANNKQSELLSTVPQYTNVTQHSTDFPVFRYFDEDLLVRLLSISNDMHERCKEFSRKYFAQGEIDISIFENPFIPSSNATLMGILYHRVQNLPKALDWMASESKESSDYPKSLHRRGLIYLQNGEYQKSVEFFQNALQDERMRNKFAWYYSLAHALLRLGKYEMARNRLKAAIRIHDEVYGKESQTIMLGQLMHLLGVVDWLSDDFELAIETFRKVEQLHKRLICVPDICVAHLSLNMAQILSEFDQKYELQSIEYVKRAIDLCHKIFGQQSLTSQLAYTYAVAAIVYERCNLNDKALSFFKRSLEVFQNVFGDNPKPDAQMPCLTHLENLQSALKHARTVFHGKPHVILASVLNNLGHALSSKKESLEYLREGKEMMDDILGANEAHPITFEILYTMGIVYLNVCGDFAKAHVCLQDALSMNSLLYGENSSNEDTAEIYEKLGITTRQTGNLRQAKKHSVEAVKIRRRIPIAKNSCDKFLDNLFCLNSICEALEEEDEALKYLEEAREVARVFGYKNWKLVVILHQLSEKYMNLGSVLKSKKCSQEAREMAMHLPEQNDFIPRSVLELIESLKIN